MFCARDWVQRRLPRIDADVLGSAPRMRQGKNDGVRRSCLGNHQPHLPRAIDLKWHTTRVHMLAHVANLNHHVALNFIEGVADCVRTVWYAVAVIAAAYVNAEHV